MTSSRTTHPREVSILGAGGFAKVVIATLRELNYQVVAAYDDDPKKTGTSVLGVIIKGTIADFLQSPPAPAVMAIGGNRFRQRIFETRPDVEWLTVTHPSAVVHESAKLGPGTLVMARAVIQPDVTIGRCCLVNSGAIVDHDCTIADFAHIGLGSRIGGGVTLEEGAFIGMGSIALPGITLGRWSTVGAGGVVIGNVRGGETVAGVPARPTSRDR